MKSQVRSRFAAAGAIVTMSIGASGALGAEPINFLSGETKTSLVELFTSEGCSSCPPAERWLSGLTRDPRLWKDYVVAAFHVDYWDGLGWKDPFARRDFSDRQQNYAAQLKTESVYTPGFVVDGKEWRGWFNHEKLPKPSSNRVGVLSATSNKAGEWELHYEPGKLESGEGLTFSAALLGFGMTSRVKAGENSGRTLEHDFVALKFATTPAKHSGQFFQGAISLPSNAALNSKRLAVAFWVTKGDDLQPLQAVGGWFGQ